MADQRLYLEFRDNCDEVVVLRSIDSIVNCTGCGVTQEIQILPPPWRLFDNEHYCSRCLEAIKKG